MAQQSVTDRQRRGLLEGETSHRRIVRHRAPSLLFSQKRPRARLCSTGLGRIPFVSKAWNEKGTRFAPYRFPRQPQRTHNDSRPRSMSRSQLRQQRSVRSRSYPSNSFRGASIQMFSYESAIGVNRCRGYAFRRHHIRNGTCRDCLDVGLFHACCHEHRCKQQRTCKKIGRSR